MTGTKAKLPLLAGAALTLVLIGTPALLADAISEIVAMLDGGLSEELIVDWLAAGDEAPERPTAEELLTLKRAGASEELLRELLRRSNPVAAEREASEVDPTPEPTMARDTTPAATPEVRPAPTPAAAAGPQRQSESRPAARPAAGGTAEVRVVLLYAPRFDEDEEETWDLFAYLDGRPLSYVPASADPLGLAAGKPLELELELPAGRHELRVLLERHWQRRGRWRHAARVGEPGFSFELAAGTQAKVEVVFRQGWGDETDPLTFRFTQGERISDLVDVGGDPESWSELCEDSGGEPGQGDCTGWSGLWSEADAPPRAEVLDALARFSFRPVPR